MLSPSGIYFASNDVEIKKVETVYRGFFKINRYSLRHRLFAGGWSAVFEREFFKRGHSVAVLPYDPHRDEVVLIRQFRIGALTDKSPWLTEIVAGVMSEYDNSQEEVAHREAKEEANLTIQSTFTDIQLLGKPWG